MSLNEPFLHGLGNGSRSAGDVQFAVDVAQVVVDGVVADLEPAGDRLHGQAVHHRLLTSG